MAALAVKVHSLSYVGLGDFNKMRNIASTTFFLLYLIGKYHLDLLCEQNLIEDSTWGMLQ